MFTEKIKLSGVAAAESVTGSQLPKSGQTTQYTAGDDGTDESGLAIDYTINTTGQYSGTTAITVNAKTDTKSNETITDNTFNIMYMRDHSSSVGPDSNGRLLWTDATNGEDIFGYLTAANSAGLSGHTDWRIPSVVEIERIREFEGSNALPNITYFDNWADSNVWSGTTRPGSTTNAMFINFGTGQTTFGAKTTSKYALVLVRDVS